MLTGSVNKVFFHLSLEGKYILTFSSTDNNKNYLYSERYIGSGYNNYYNTVHIDEYNPEKIDLKFGSSGSLLGGNESVRDFQLISNLFLKF